MTIVQRYGPAALGKSSATLAALVVLALAPAIAEPAKQRGAKRPNPTVGTAGPSVPEGTKLNMLIRTTLIALNQANQTGNYSVLRDLGTAQFQSMNTDARLAEIFAGLRGRDLDLSPILFFDPKLVREPVVQAGGLLRLTGYIPTEPQRVLFDMGFERAGDQWRLSAIVIDVQPTPAASAANEPPRGAQKSLATPSGQPDGKRSP